MVQRVDTDITHTAQTTSPQSDLVALLRAELIDGRPTIDELAAAAHLCIRATRKKLDAARAPYVRIGRLRFYERASALAALLGEVVDRTPRRRGRPAGRKAGTQRAA